MSGSKIIIWSSLLFMLAFCTYWFHLYWNELLRKDLWIMPMCNRKLVISCSIRQLMILLVFCASQWISTKFFYSYWWAFSNLFYMSVRLASRFKTYMWSLKPVELTWGRNVEHTQKQPCIDPKFLFSYFSFSLNQCTLALSFQINCGDPC